jgi:hypothetical protein
MPQTLKHYVTTYAPGSFVDETTSRPIEAWDVRRALEIAGEVVERYDARPFAFRFTTRDEPPPIVLDGVARAVEPIEVAKSGMYFINAEILSLSDVEARAAATPRAYSILASNMRANGWAHVAETKTPYTHCAVFDPTVDVNIDAGSDSPIPLAVERP